MQIKNLTNAKLLALEKRTKKKLPMMLQEPKKITR
jgi:hypothetical protein